MRPASRRTLLAYLAALAAAIGALLLHAAVPEPPLPSPPAPQAAADLPDAPGSVALPDAASRPVAPASVLTAVPGDRELLWAERGTGVVRRGPVTRTGVAGSGQIVARLAVTPGPEAGIRGLAVGDDGRVYASFVRRSDRRLVVAEIGIDRPRVLWRGPRVSARRVGGGLIVLPGGRLALAVGDQQRSVAAQDRRSILGRVISLDPNAGAGQAPRRRSRGWHDPTALALGRRGQIWVADRAGAGDAERIGRADGPRLGTVRSPVRRAPSGLAIGDDGRTLIVCGYRSGRLDRTELRGVVAGSEPQVVRARCRYGVAVVGQRVYVSGDDGRIRSAGTVAQLRAAPEIQARGD